VSVFIHVGVFRAHLPTFARVAVFDLRLLLLDVGPEDANLVVFVFLEIESELLTEPQLQKIVIQGLLGHPHFLGSVFE